MISSLIIQHLSKYVFIQMCTYMNDLWLFRQEKYPTSYDCVEWNFLLFSMSFFKKKKIRLINFVQPSLVCSSHFLHITCRKKLKEKEKNEIHYSQFLPSVNEKSWFYNITYQLFKYMKSKCTFNTHSGLYMVG